MNANETGDSNNTDGAASTSNTIGAPEIDISEIVEKEHGNSVFGIKTNPTPKKQKEDKPVKVDNKKASNKNSKKADGKGLWNTYFRKKLDTAFGIDISDSSIELLEFKPFFSHFPRSHSRVELEDGIVERGKIVDKAKLQAKLQTLLLGAKPNKVSTNRAVLSLPEEHTFTWSMTTNKSLSDSELRTKIFEEAKKVVPLDFKKVYWDYTVYTLPEKGMKYVTFVGIDQPTLNDYVEVCNRLGIDVVEFSLIATSLARVFLPKKSKTNSAIIDMGGEISSISIFSGSDLLKLSVSIPIAGDDFTKAISSELSITELEAEQMKIQFGFTEGPNPGYKAAVDKVMDELLSEIQQAIDYYERSTSEKIEMVYITGGTSLLKEAEVVMTEKLNRKISELSSLEFVTNSKIFKKDINLKLYANAVGNALLGITKGDNALSFRKQMAVKDLDMGFWSVVKTGYYAKFKMIFDYKRVAYITVILITILLITLFTFMYLDMVSKGYQVFPFS